MRSLWNKITLSAVALVAAGIGAGSAQAQFPFASFTNNSFANFRYDSTANQFFSTLNNEAFSSIPVNFRFNVNTLYGPAFTNIDATMTFQSNGGATVDAENALPLTGVNMVITADTPGVLGSNLLTLTGSTGRIRGTNDSNSIPVSGDTSLGNTVNFSSAYLDFSSTSQRIFAFTNSDASPNYTISGTPPRPQSFDATYIGTFSTAPRPNAFTVPEANAGLLAGFALPFIGVLIARRRK